MAVNIKSLIAAALVAMPSFLAAQSNITLNVHQENNWVWYIPQTPEIKVTVANHSANNHNSDVTLNVETDTHKHLYKFSQKVNIAAGDSTELSFSFPAQPGFYTCSVATNGAEEKKFNIGYEPEHITSLPDYQADFHKFWADALAELAKVEPCYTMVEEKDKSNKTGKVYLVTMKSYGNDTIQGYLTIPNACSKKKPFPIIVHYMGYGSKPWYPHPDSNPDFIEFVLSSRGQGLCQPSNKYGDWIQSGLESKDTYYYKGAFMDVVRTLDFVSQLPQVDTRNIFAEGGSQGGAFTLAACALDKRIRAAAPWIPFLSDYPDYFKIVHWPAEPVLRKQKELNINDADLYKTLSYFDIKNLAHMIKCPILMGAGLQDPVCPPHTNFSGYNHITSEKKYIIYPNCGHDCEHPVWDKAQIEFYRQNMAK